MKEVIERQKKYREQNVLGCLKDDHGSCKDLDKVSTVDVIRSSSTEVTVMFADFEGGIDEELLKSRPSDVFYHSDCQYKLQCQHIGTI